MTLTARNYQDALEVQDACNLSGVVHSFSKVMSSIMGDASNTHDVNRHPIAVLYADKIASLAGVQSLSYDSGFSAAYDICCERAKV